MDSEDSIFWLNAKYFEKNEKESSDSSDVIEIAINKIDRNNDSSNTKSKEENKNIQEDGEQSKEKPKQVSLFMNKVQIANIDMC